jgi:hypothetical protein
VDAKRASNRLAPHSVLRVFLKSAKGAARTFKRIRNRFAPHSVLRVFLERASKHSRPRAALRNAVQSVSASDKPWSASDSPGALVSNAARKNLFRVHK